MTARRLDLNQAYSFRVVDGVRMMERDEKPTGDRETGEKLPPTNDLLRTLEAYAAELRRIIEMLRKRLH